MGLHVHQVEVDEAAARAPRPHADAQLLGAAGGEDEGAVRIHLRKPAPGAAATVVACRSSTTASSEHKPDPTAPNALHTKASTTEPQLRRVV